MTKPSTAHRFSTRRVATVLCLAFVAFVVTGCGAASVSEGVEEPTFDFVIPAGSGDRIDAGESLDILPRELTAELDETIQIVNNDDQAHLLGPWFVGAGETLRQRFSVAGVYEGACSVHPAGEFTVVVNPTTATRSSSEDAN